MKTKKKPTLKIRIKKTPLFHRAAWIQPIPSLPTYYASEDGIIYRSHLEDLSDLTQLHVSETGGSESKRYPSVNVYGNKTCHRLTAETFLSKDGHTGYKVWSSDLVVDHIDLTTNNRIENLRMLTYSQNSLNNTAHGYYWNGYTWVVRLTFNGKKYSWPGYKDESKARAKYLYERSKFL